MDLGAGGVERAGAVDDVGGVTQFFLEGKLSGDAAAGFRLAHVAGEESLELLFGSAEHNHESVEIFCESGFDEKRGFHESGIAKAGALPGVELEEHGLLNAGMENGIEASEFGGIGENDGGEFGTVDASRALGEIGAEFTNDVIVSGQAGFHELVREGVGVKDREAEFAKNGSDGAFAAGDAPGEAKF